MGNVAGVGKTPDMPRRVRPQPKRIRRRYYFREWRKYRHLTQEQLAERVDMSVSSVSQIETGTQGFTDATLQAFADALMCSPGDLLSRDPEAEGEVVDMMRLIERKDAGTVRAFLNALPDKTGTE